MPELKSENRVRTSLEVGFPDGKLPEKYETYRGRATRAIGAVKDFPFEDAQFEVVLMSAEAVNASAVKEAHRVLRPEGRLYFTVPEKAGDGSGFTMPEIYSIVRYGFNVIGVDRSPWWAFWVRKRTVSICAQKKNWRSHDNTFRPYV